MLEMILGQIWPYLLGLLGLLAMVAGWVTARQSGKAEGRTQAKIDQLEDNAKARGVAREADQKFDQIPTDDLRDRARERLRNTANR